MARLGHPGPAVASEFFSTDTDNPPDWYRFLVLEARGHVASNAWPPLETAPRLFVDYHREYIEALCENRGIDAQTWPELR
jgi:hypothetical protein